MTLWFCHHNPGGFRGGVQRVNLAVSPSLGDCRGQHLALLAGRRWEVCGGNDERKVALPGAEHGRDRRRTLERLLGRVHLLGLWGLVPRLPHGRLPRPLGERIHPRCPRHLPGEPPRVNPRPPRHPTGSAGRNSRRDRALGKRSGPLRRLAPVRQLQHRREAGSGLGEGQGLLRHAAADRRLVLRVRPPAEGRPAEGLRRRERLRTHQGQG
jgi:hypothetical protein